MKELYSALAKAQAEIGGATKGKVNPHFKSRYADLASVVDAVKEPLAKHGLAFIQRLHERDHGIGVETIILHESGQELSAGTVFVPATKADAQGYGSAITYGRRYSLQTAFGVPAEDDDGNAAVGNQVKVVNPPPGIDYSVQERAIRGCATIGALQETWKALSAAERKALAGVKDQVKAQIELAELEAANA